MVWLLFFTIKCNTANLLPVEPVINSWRPSCATFWVSTAPFIYFKSKILQFKSKQIFTVADFVICEKLPLIRMHAINLYKVCGNYRLDNLNKKAKTLCKREGDNTNVLRFNMNLFSCSSFKTEEKQNWLPPRVQTAYADTLIWSESWRTLALEIRKLCLTSRPPASHTIIFYLTLISNTIVRFFKSSTLLISFRKLSGKQQK